jgi:hypothetical protein
MLLLTIICWIFATGFGAAFYFLKSSFSRRTAVAWALYPLYEVWIQSRCVGSCDIRIDLLLVAPIILTLSIIALISAIKSINKIKRNLPKDK